MKKTLKILWILVILAAFAGPLLSFSAYPRLFAFRILFPLHLLLFYCFYLFYPSIVREIHIREYVIFFAIWLIWAFVSFFWAASSLAVIKNSALLFSGIGMTLFTVLYYSSLADFKRLLFLNMVILTVLVTMGFWELATGLHLCGGWPGYFLKSNSLPVTGVFGHPNNFATYLGMYLPVAYILARWSKNIFLKGICLLVLVGGLHLIIAADSRANMVGLLLGIAVGFFLYLMEKRRFLSSVIIPIMLAAAIFGGALFYPPTARMVQSESSRFISQVTSLYENRNYDGSIRVRKTLMQNGIEIFIASRGLGAGAGNGEYLMQRYSRETFGHLKMHNWWLEVLVDYGLLVFLLYLVFFGKLIRDLWRVFRRTPDRILSLSACGMLISLAVFSVGVVSNGSMTASLHMWLLYGIALSVVNIFRCETKTGESQKERV